MDKIIPKANANNDKDFNDRLFNFIVQFEWYNPKSYWDYKQYSIWFGTLSFKWETITWEEAKKRKQEHINYIVERNPFINDIKNDNHKIAIISFIYNVWSLKSYQKRYINNWYWKALWNNFLLYNKSNWKELWWLVKRRNAEKDLLYK